MGAVCEPTRLEQKYPGLANRTLKIGADPQTQPYVMRNATDFQKVEGVDADLARAVLDCVGATRILPGGLVWSSPPPS